MGDNSARQLKPLASIVVNEATFEWHHALSLFTFFGVESVLFWLKPSLKSILQPLREEVGEELYSCLIAHEASKGTYEDFHSMVTTLGQNFEEGFIKWGRAVSACGWGDYHLLSIDWDRKEARLRVDNPWETKIFESNGSPYDVPFLRGKISGIFTHAFGTNCRAEVEEIVAVAPGRRGVLLKIAPSSLTLEQALKDIQKSAPGNELLRLRSENNALRRSDRRLLDIIETFGGFIWEADRELQITHISGKSKQNTFGGGQPLVGRHWSEFLRPDDLADFRRALNLLSIEQPFVDREYEVTGPNDQRHWIEIRTKRVLDFSGNHLGFLGSVGDVTEKRNLERQLKKQESNSQFAAKMATLGEMAGSIAHEINTPLAVISLLAEELSESLKEEKPQRQARKIAETTQKIAKIVQGLRTFARDASQDAGTLVALDSLLEDTFSLCQSRFRNGGVQLVTPAKNPQLQIKCRSTQIVQVLLNLLNNAHDAVAHSPAAWVRVEIFDQPNRLILRVIDSGPGIPDAVQQKMMTPFFTTKPIGQGTGLGLSISKGIIESHGGTLRYDSGAPTTTFIVELPK